MGRQFGSVPTPAYRRVMIFIDGGYLREGLKREFGTNRISPEGFQKLLIYLTSFVGKYDTNVRGELIRTYYYDAVVNESEQEKRQEQNAFFSKIRNVPFCKVRL